MKRIPLTPRPGWQQIVEAQGLAFHTLDNGQPYWDESAAYEFTAADIMTVFSLTTMRLFYPADLTPYPAILTYLWRVGERPAYRRAMEKGDPGFKPMLDATV